MKALSLKQPFAELIVQGKKTIEIRKWNTNFRGEFFIHASKNIDKEASEKHNLRNLPTGCIVGKATLVAVKKYESKQSFEQAAAKHLASLKYWNKNAHGFILKNTTRINPIPYKGQLNFFEVEL